ncbi:MAG: carbohydrate ABC transporter permease [Acidimicrobiia bacterium]
MSTANPAGAVPTVDAAPARTRTKAGGETIGRSVSTTLSSRTGRYLVYALVVLWTIPTFGLFVSSFRGETAVKTTGWWTVLWNPSLTIDNYRASLSSAPGSDNMGQFFLNSLEITVPAVILSIGIALIAAYAFSWMEFPGRDWLFVGVVSMLVVPLQMCLIPLLRLFTGGAHIGDVTIFPYLHLNNNVAAVWIAHTIFGLPFCIFILKNFVSALPREVIEAARVDGAGHLTIFTRLVLPLSVPAVASLGIFQFMWIWNDLLVGKVFGGSKNLPVIAKLVDVVGTRGQAWHLLTAAAVISMVVPLVVFFSLQRFFVRGLLAGAVKG